MAKKKSTLQAADDDGGIDFELSLNEVERIVARLESGELGLTESLEQYETAIKQLKRCHALLDAAEQRVSVLSGFDADGNPVTEPLQDLEFPTSDSPDKKPARSRRRAVSTQEGYDGSEDALNRGGLSQDSVDDFPGLF